MDEVHKTKPLKIKQLSWKRISGISKFPFHVAELVYKYIIYYNGDGTFNLYCNRERIIKDAKSLRYLQLEAQRHLEKTILSAIEEIEN